MKKVGKETWAKRTLETQARRRKKGDVQKAMLAALMIAGVISVALVAPKTLRLLRYAPTHRIKFLRNMHSAAERLVRNGYAAWMERDGKKFLRITEKGRKSFAFEQAKASLVNQKKKRWDERWRMVIFDVPERRRGVRIRLRTTMQEIGFVRLQNSVWVYPYDCEDFIALLKTELKIGKDVLYVVADAIEHDKRVRAHFGLPLS